jgi:hypothetical protein
MGGVNAAIEVEKHKLDVALGSGGELLSEPNQTRAITRLVKRLAELGCERVLIEGGSYQTVLCFPCSLWISERGVSNRWKWASESRPVKPLSAIFSQ